jgi:hypothetical protein
MTQTELVAAVSDRTGLKARDVRRVLLVLGEVLIDVVAVGDRVYVPSIGRFEKRGVVYPRMSLKSSRACKERIREAKEVADGR